MPIITVTSLVFTDDTISLRLDSPTGWAEAAVGVTDAFNLVCDAQGDAFDQMPPTLPVDIASRSPNRAGGTATLKQTRLDLSKDQDLGTTTRYALTKSWDDLAFKATDSVREVVTVMRQGTDATAADDFRAVLHFTVRGFARQPTFVKDSSGAFVLGPDTGDPDRKLEIPSANFLVDGGGLEILEAKVPEASDRKVVAAPARALVRSPADIWFYSGHGVEDGFLAVGPLNGTHTYLVWRGAADFLAAWVNAGNKSRTTDMKMLIINGCNVLNLVQPAAGKQWARLLQPRGGNLTHILGYAKKAPLDIGGGAQAAAEIGRAIRRGDDPVKAWLDINVHLKPPRWGAVALDAKGYHAFDDKHKRVTLPLP